jgi:hypothetical protein
VFEFFGRPATDTSQHARDLAEAKHCPFIGERCEKTLSDGKVAGVCSIKPVTSGPVICCPIRLYGDGYKILRDVSAIAFEPGLKLVPGREARSVARATGEAVVGVFGRRWGGELPLPRKKGGGSYFIDWILARIEANGELTEFTAVEVQTIDTTGNYRNGILALEDAVRSVVKTTAGLNWENVSKRIIPQLIYKAQVLQRETKVNRGLFFVCPAPVFNKIEERLGGIDALPVYPMKGGTITFLSYDYARIQGQPLATEGELPIEQTRSHTTSVDRFQFAFNNVALSQGDAYGDAIEKVLGP